MISHNDGKHEMNDIPRNNKNKSVGVPSSIYDTVRSLRQARALRLGDTVRLDGDAHKTRARGAR